MRENPSEHSSEAEAREDLHDRWFFNLVVFFALLPFTLLLSYITDSFIEVGFGVALVAWRVAVTPEITNPISSKVHGQSRQFLQDPFISLVSGFTLLGVSDLATTQTSFWDARKGFPLSYSQPGTACSPGGCVMVYDPLYIVLDNVFWAGVAFALISIFRVAWIRYVHYPNNDRRPFGG